MKRTNASFIFLAALFTVLTGGDCSKKSSPNPTPNPNPVPASNDVEMWLTKADQSAGKGVTKTIH